VLITPSPFLESALDVVPAPFRRYQQPVTFMKRTISPLQLPEIVALRLAPDGLTDGGGLPNFCWPLWQSMLFIWILWKGVGYASRAPTLAAVVMPETGVSRYCGTPVIQMERSTTR
jgi:hypothetical protein